MHSLHRGITNTITLDACMGQAHSPQRVKWIWEKLSWAWDSVPSVSRYLSLGQEWQDTHPGPGVARLYFPSITSQTFCSNSQDSIVTMPTVKTAAFPRQLGWSCLCTNTLCFCAYWMDTVLSLQLNRPAKCLLDWLAFCLWMPKSTLRFNTGFYY